MIRLHLVERIDDALLPLPVINCQAGLEPATNGFAGGGSRKVSLIVGTVGLQRDSLSSENQREPLRGSQTGHTRRISADQNMFAPRGFRAAPPAAQRFVTFLTESGAKVLRGG
jgi:hypothetical protein